VGVEKCHTLRCPGIGLCSHIRRKVSYTEMRCLDTDNIEFVGVYTLHAHACYAKAPLARVRKRISL